jgi:hypothetical protein
MLEDFGLVFEIISMEVCKVGRVGDAHFFFFSADLKEFENMVSRILKTWELTSYQETLAGGVKRDQFLLYMPSPSMFNTLLVMLPQFWLWAGSKPELS